MQSVGAPYFSRGSVAFRPCEKAPQKYSSGWEAGLLPPVSLSPIMRYHNYYLYNITERQAAGHDASTDFHRQILIAETRLEIAVTS